MILSSLLSSNTSGVQASSSSATIIDPWHTQSPVTEDQASRNGSTDWVPIRKIPESGDSLSGSLKEASVDGQVLLNQHPGQGSHSYDATDWPSSNWCSASDPAEGITPSVTESVCRSCR